MKSFAAALLITAAQADADPYSGADHYHNDYNTGYASAAPLLTAKFSEQMESFKMKNTLFGTENYQLQVAKTANMLIATEALRLSTANLQNRVEYAQALCDQNQSDIEENASDIDDNQRQIQQNAEALELTADRLDSLEEGYDHLNDEKAIDRAVIEKMCHQYAYASTLVDECLPILEDMSAPMGHSWQWPEQGCDGPARLPPFNNHVSKRDKDTENDDDDLENERIPEPRVKTYPSEHYH